MIDLPIIIDSPEMDFVIVGPVSTNADGILVRSKNLDNRILAKSRILYSETDSKSFKKDEIYAQKIAKITQELSTAKFKWFEMDWNPNRSSLNIEARDFEILFGWYFHNYDESKFLVRPVDKRVANKFETIKYQIIQTIFHKTYSPKFKDNHTLWLMSEIISLPFLRF